VLPTQPKPRWVGQPFPRWGERWASPPACPTGSFTANYTYDIENRLTAAAGYTYAYDGDGNRVKKCSNAGCTTGTLYWTGIGTEPLDETGIGGALSEEYVFFNGKRIARRDSPSNTVHYFFSDHLGSTALITDATGATIQEESDYYPYGGEIAITNGDPNNYKFTAKERDAESNLDNFGARFYSPAGSRFMTPDWAAKATVVPYAEFGDPQTLNLYAYVRNNPILKPDADGHGDAGTFCNTQCRYGTQVSESEIQVSVGILEVSSAVATGGATLETLEAGAALKTALGAISTSGLFVSGSTRIITGTAGETENVEQGASAVTTITTPVGMAVTLGTGGNIKAGAVASDVTSAASMVAKPAEAMKNPAGDVLTVNNVVQDVKAGISAVKSLVSPPPPPPPPPAPPAPPLPKCTGNVCH
jgi:RHS repeat-associated protein